MFSVTTAVKISWLRLRVFVTDQATIGTQTLLRTVYGYIVEL